MARCALVTGNLILFTAVVACGIAFFGPFWLANVRPDELGSGEGNGTYFIYRFVVQQPDETYVRGLWAECGRRCQWFWQNNNALQTELFIPLGKQAAYKSLLGFSPYATLHYIEIFNVA